ncbi:MAG: twin-arginine translocation signal domain-containing protein [Pirellulales bacterium]|nr:twin-arginine translocation signal domain-containing protein [Pirellulales bacterium]
MDRRDFLKTGAKTAATGALAGTALSIPAQDARAAGSPNTNKSTGDPGTSVLMRDFTADDHRRRLQNIGICTQKIRKCMRKHLITNYLPAQCVYNLGEYPSRKPWAPNEYDEQELDRLKGHGIQLIQVMDEWNDRYGLFGGNKLTAVNPEGFRRFVSMVHKRGIKILAYASSGYFAGHDPDYRKEWARPGDICDANWWDLPRCSPASPGWRAYLLPRMLQILEDYELDGLYNDWGYVPNSQKRIKQPAKDEMLVFEETPRYDGAVADLLHLIYSEVKRRGGIYKMHADRSNQPQTGGLKVYDYLWVGEGVADVDGMREAVKNHAPYVVPCIHGSRAKVESDNSPFLHSIPYMQFPLLQGGRPLTGERAVVPIPRMPGAKENGFYTRAWKYYQDHPNGPYIYGGWDTLPPSAETRPTHARWLKQYMPLVEEGTWAYLEIGDSDLFAKPLPKDCVASAFANRELYMVMANYGKTPVVIETADTYVPTDTPSAAPAKKWQIPKRSLRIVKRAA